MKEQDERDLNIIQINAGDIPAKKQTKYERVDRRLINLLNNYEKETKDGFSSFLNNVAHNIYL